MDALHLTRNQKKKLRKKRARRFGGSAKSQFGDRVPDQNETRIHCLAPAPPCPVPSAEPLQRTAAVQSVDSQSACCAFSSHMLSEASTSDPAHEAQAIESDGHRDIRWAPAPSLDTVAPRSSRNGGRRIFLYGNYHRYYGYRLGQAFDQDPRLSCLDKSWFTGKRCLDIGCNEGLVTMAMSMRFGSKSMVGIDIDEHLIRKACTNLREERMAAIVQARATRRGGMPASERRSARLAVASLSQTWFVHGDFLESRVEDGSLDCITAFSVAKWIHINRGDVGLRAFFERVYTLLRPGGYFVLEPQPWKSYRAAANKIKKHGKEVGLSATDRCPIVPASGYFHRIDQLSLRPEAFSEFLTRELGFNHLRVCKPPEETAPGFDRPLLLFRKPQ